MIEEMGYEDYFLIVWDFIKFAKDANIAVGPGRGSGGGSLVAYALNITTVDPMKYELLFERFLNPERITLPDFDIDFEDERRQEVIDYVCEKYGKENVAQIITFGTLGARAAVRDVGRVLGMPLFQVDKVAKAIPFSLNMTLDRALDESHRLKELAQEEDVELLLDMAKSRGNTETRFYPRSRGGHQQRAGRTLCASLSAGQVDQHAVSDGDA